MSCSVWRAVSARLGVVGCGVTSVPSRHFRRLPVKTVSRLQLEPDYLLSKTAMKPTRFLVNIQMRGYNFAVLERYARWAHRMTAAMGLHVASSWATPAASCRVTRLKPASELIASEYQLHLYERNVQLSELPATSSSLLLDVLQAGLPPGVRLQLHQHDAELHEKVRYIPDMQLKELQEEIEAIGTDGYDKRKRSATVEHWLGRAPRSKR